jgi:hypothetical protein
MVGASFVTVVAEVIRRKIGITAIGNAQVDTAQSQFGGASALFDGTGDLLQADTTASLTIASSENFTIEGWIRPGSVSGTPGLLTDRASSNSLAGVNWDISMFNGTYITSRTNTFLFETGSGAGSIVIISNNNVFTTNTWYHFAVVRNSNVITLYVNGTDVTNNRTGTQSSAIGAGNLTIGGFPNGSAMYTGHMDEIRWSNSARYTAGFTPSTTAFVNDANTKLLLHMDGTDAATFFEDDNGVRLPKSIQAFGNAQVSTAQSQFGGSSFLGDGTGDYLLITSHSDFAFGTGDFTIEAWVRPTNFTSGPIIVDFRTGDPQICPTLYISTGGVVLYYTNGATRITGSTLSINTWYHIALCRSSASTKLFVNGTQVGSTYSDTNNYVEKPAYISAYGGGTTFGNLNGYIDEFRISNSARYTANFTSSTTPFVNDANTKLLLHMNGTNASTFFEDDNGVRASIGLAAGNQAQISTAQSKFGGSSIVFDGADDFVTVTGLPSYVSSNYTFECWARFDILPHAQTYAGGNYMMMNYAGSGDYVLITRTGAGSQVIIQIAHAGNYGSFTKSGVNYAINTWYHIAVVRNSGVFKVFFNGTDLTTFINDSGFTNSGRTQNIFVGQLGKFGDGRGSWDGYMDEIRISNTARYTGDYTPPTAPFVNDANTQLLIHADGTNASKVFRDDNGVTPTHSYT